MSAAPPLTPKKDKYEQVLARYDWSAPYPPRGYQYGVGRGAKAFTTSAELSSATGAAAFSMLQTPDQTGLLVALDRLEERRQKRRKVDAKSGAGDEGSKSKTVLSMEDLASIGSGIVGQSLVKRKARTEDMDVVDDYAFADETTVVTASDLMHSRSIATNQTLENILGMGSPTEQTTWITHSRAYREMGMTKKAQRTLVEGCKLTGSKGPLIWKERLEYIQDPAAQRLVLEEAVKVCPGCEELWLLLLEHEPPHTQLHWLQQGVMACPASESLWLRVLGHIPTPRDQKKIIRKALEVTPRLPSLWAMLARLEDYETGKAIFNAAAAEHLSLQIVIEAAKFEEFHSNRESRGDHDNINKGTVKQLKNETIQSFVHQAAQRFLAVDEEKSRREWFEVAQSAACERYVITSAYMYLYFASDKKAGVLSVSTTWVKDLMALIPGAWKTHNVLCSMWAATLILHHMQMSSPDGNRNGVGDRSNKGVGGEEEDILVMTVALQLAPSSVIDAALLELRGQLPSFGTMLGVLEQEKKEGEEEELERPGAKDTTLEPLSGNATCATAASQRLPLPLTFVLLWTVLETPPAFGEVEVTLRIAKVLYDRGFFEGASCILKLGITRHPMSTALFAATAKTLMAMKREAEAEQILLRGTEIMAVDTDIVWVKLAIHRRSRHEDILPLTENAIAVFPKSEKLWLMRLEATGTKMKAALDEATRQGASTAPIITELRQIYGKALGAAHCRFSPTLWCYIAVHFESTLLSNAGVARALLLEGAVVCQEQQSNKKAEIHAAFGLARCQVELAHAGRETALEVVREVLQLLPKKNGCFTVPVGELVALSIDLEAPAARGRAAAQAVQHWRVRDPLVLTSVAKVYHAAGKHDKALDQVLKAVKMSKGCCGDAVALWLKFASMPVYQCLVAEQMGMLDESGTAKVGEAITMHALLEWLCEQLASDVSGSEMDKDKSRGSDKRRPNALRPNSGPLWLHVAKAQDPSNVTLLGYRDSLESMLQRVVDLMEL